MSGSTAPGERPPSERGVGRDEASTPPRWQQRAAFSVFVDTTDDADGHTIRQTRVYHEESGDETTFTGFDQTALVAWMVRRIDNSPTARSPIEPAGEGTSGAAAPAPPTRTHLLRVDVMSVRLLERTATPQGSNDQDVRIEARLRIAELPRLLGSLGEVLIAAVVTEASTDPSPTNRHERIVEAFGEGNRDVS